MIEDGEDRCLLQVASFHAVGARGLMETGISGKRYCSLERVNTYCAPSDQLVEIN